MRLAEHFEEREIILGAVKYPPPGMGAVENLIDHPADRSTGFAGHAVILTSRPDF